MKRMALIGSVLLILLFIASAAEFAFAQQQAKPSEGSYKFEFPVTLEGQVVGSVTIDAKHETFSFAGKGLIPRTRYFLVVTELYRSLGSAETKNTGALRIQDAYDQSFWADLTETPTFVLSISPPVGGVGCIPTELTATSYTALFWGNVHGALTDASGNPLPGRTIYIDDPDRDDWYETVTNSSGDFSYTRAFWVMYYLPQVDFLGDSAHCSSWTYAR